MKNEKSSQCQKQVLFCTLHSPMLPSGLHVESTWPPGCPSGLHMDSRWAPDGLHMDSTWTPHGLQMGSTWTPHGLHIDSRSPWWTPSPCQYRFSYQIN